MLIHNRIYFAYASHGALSREGQLTPSQACRMPFGRADTRGYEQASLVCQSVRRLSSRRARCVDASLGNRAFSAHKLGNIVQLIVSASHVGGSRFALLPECSASRSRHIAHALGCLGHVFVCMTCVRMCFGVLFRLKVSKRRESFLSPLGPFANDNLAHCLAGPLLALASYSSASCGPPAAGGGGRQIFAGTAFCVGLSIRPHVAEITTVSSFPGHPSGRHRSPPGQTWSNAAHFFSNSDQI